MWSKVALALTLAACGATPLPAPAGVDRVALPATELGRWVAFLGPLKDCSRELLSLRWERDAGAGADTFRYAADGAPVVTLAPGETARDARHELTHWLAWCSGLVPGGDPSHKSVIWSAPGVSP